MCGCATSGLTCSSIPQARLFRVGADGMNSIEKQVHEVLHNINWLIEPHNSFVELVDIRGNNVVIRSTGACDTCETDCIGTAFKERMPDIKLVREQ